MPSTPFHKYGNVFSRAAQWIGRGFAQIHADGEQSIRERAQFVAEGLPAQCAGPHREASLGRERQKASFIPRPHDRGSDPCERVSDRLAGGGGSVR